MFHSHRMFHHAVLAPNLLCLPSSSNGSLARRKTLRLGERQRQSRVRSPHLLNLGERKSSPIFQSVPYKTFHSWADGIHQAISGGISQLVPTTERSGNPARSIEYECRALFTLRRDFVILLLLRLGLRFFVSLLVLVKQSSSPCLEGIVVTV